METKFSFKEVDKEGELTLDTIAGANRFNRWMYDTIRPYCTGRILEIGSGIGNISQYFVDDQHHITLSDVRKQYVDQLKKKFPKNGAVQMDLTHLDFDTVYKDHLRKYDSLFALNVVEHIEDDQLAIKNIKKLLKPSGTCIILVPAFDFLYNSFDEDLYHFRRYNRKKLKELIEPHLTIKYSRYFNPIGIAGWYLNGNILKKKHIPSDQMQLFDRFVPLFKGVDYVTRQLFGLSVIAVSTND